MNREKGLMFVPAKINGQQTQALVDTRATYNFITEVEAECLPRDGLLKMVNTTVRLLVGIDWWTELRLGLWYGPIDIFSVPMDLKLVLGLDFLTKVNAIHMLSSDSIYILEKWSSCTVPTISMGMEAGQLLAM